MSGRAPPVSLKDQIARHQSKWLTDHYWVTPYNWLDEVRKDFDLPPRIYFHDVTLREADQHPGIALRKEEKLRIAEALNDLGVGSLEIAPMISKEDEEATKAIAHLGLATKVIAFCSWRKEDVDLARQCGVDGVILDFVGNPWQSNAFWGLSEEEHLRRGVEAISYAKSHGLFTIALPWDDYRAPLEFLERNYKACVNEGKADHVTVTETFGFALPWTTLWFVKKVRSWVPGVPVEKHGHNDYGLATADQVAAVAGGAQVCQTTMCGVGERVGNASTEEVAVAVEVLLGVETGINLEKIYYTAKLVQDLTKFRVSPTKPVIGDNIFATTSGWISWMKAKAREAGRPTGLLPFTPDLIGAPPERYVIGKGSGRGLVGSKLEALGLRPTDEQLDKITELVKQESILRKGALSEFELEVIAKRVMTG